MTSIVVLLLCMAVFILAVIAINNFAYQRAQIKSAGYKMEMFGRLQVLENEFHVFIDEYHADKVKNEERNTSIMLFIDAELEAKGIKLKRNDERKSGEESGAAVAGQ
jgi:hypothetical protein